MTPAVRCASWRAEIRGSAYTGATGIVVDATMSDAIVKGSIDWAETRTEQTIPRVSLDLDCCGKLADRLRKATPRMHELWLWREGHDVPSFVGPLMGRLSADVLTLTAVGRSWWWWHRRRRTTESGDATAVALALWDDAIQQGLIGSDLDTRRHGFTGDVSDGVQIGTTLADLGVRWAEFGQLIQIGPHVYATEPHVFTAADFESTPAIAVDGEAWVSEIDTGDDQASIDPRFWGASIGVDSSGVAADVIRAQSSRWTFDAAGGAVIVPGPRRMLSTGDIGADGLSSSLRRGVGIDWGQLRPGGRVRVGVTTPCGDTLGTERAPVLLDVTRLHVDLGAHGAETGVGFDAIEPEDSLTSS